jgi:predicted AAA+ superfamily ATPase
VYPFERTIVLNVLQGLQGKKKNLHIITGPRQVGKTTAAHQIAAKWPGKSIHASADSPLPPGPEWIYAQWDRAVRLRHKGGNQDVLLILDEIQKVRGWSETIKLLWDRECQDPVGLQVLMLGSSSLLLQQDLSESLTGRFFLYRCTHWQYREMVKAFGWNFEQWIYFGGYPGSAELINQEDTWRSYVTDSLIETVLAKDILQLQTVAKPALLRHLFLLACGTPAQILSYNKMLGQLHDAGNTTTLAHYLRLLESAFLISGLELFKRGKLKKRGSSPKLILWNNALITAVSGSSSARDMDDYSWRGRLIENAVGAHLLNHLSGLPYTLYYWRQRHFEVDFIVETPRDLWAIEVKSGQTGNRKGLSKFCEIYPEAKPLVLGHDGMSLDDFFNTAPVAGW